MSGAEGAIQPFAIGAGLPLVRPKAEGYRQQRKELREVHREMIRLATEGHENKEIAEMLGMAQSTVGNVLNSDLAQEYRLQLQGVANVNTMKIVEDIKATVPSAIRVHKALIEGFLDPVFEEDEKTGERKQVSPKVAPAVAQRSADSIMAKAGFGDIKREVPKEEQGFVARVEKNLLTNAEKAGIITVEGGEVDE